MTYKIDKAWKLKLMAWKIPEALDSLQILLALAFPALSKSLATFSLPLMSQSSTGACCERGISGIMQVKKTKKGEVVRCAMHFISMECVIPENMHCKKVKLFP